jgi:membrane-associated protein
MCHDVQARNRPDFRVNAVDQIKFLIDVVLHLNRHLAELSNSMGGWLYAVLFAVVFCETGLIVTPFLPGDSLLFAVGALVAIPEAHLSLPLMFVLLLAAAIAGDAVNYSIGRKLGPAVFRSETNWLLNQSHLLKAQKFYERHGGKAIFLARFLPIVRTFAPFVAGIGRMNYSRFWMFNVTGAICWVGLFLLGGYFFGNVPIVKRNFSLVILGIIIVSVLPVAFEWYKAVKESRQSDNAKV